MQGIPLQKDYWDRVAPAKRFSHPPRLEWLLQRLGPPTRILDHGCGYGRLLDQLARAGYRNAVGMDFAEKMLMACRSRFPNLMLVRNDGRTLPFCDRAFDAVLLFAVLTCIPTDDDQRIFAGGGQAGTSPWGHSVHQRPAHQHRCAKRGTI